MLIRKSHSASCSLSMYFLSLAVILSLAVVFNFTFFQSSDEQSSNQKYSIQTAVTTAIEAVATKAHDLETQHLAQNYLAIPSPNDSTESLNPPQSSKYAYVTLLSGIDKSQKYRGFLYNVLIMKKALMKVRSTADFIALIGFSDPDTSLYMKDINLLKNNGIIVYYLPRFVDPKQRLTFAEMALLKITPWRFTQYDRIQFLDGDVMPTKNMDCFFSLDVNTFTVGAASPLNSGWYLAVPNFSVYSYLKKKAIWRLGCDWDENLGWGESIDNFDLTFRGGNRHVSKWSFNGADMDQGLFTYYFLLNNGNANLIDTDTHTVRKFENGLKYSKDVKFKMSDVLRTCDGIVPTSFYAHFTGRAKPWLSDDKLGASRKISQNLIIWMNFLDELNLPINSSNVHQLSLGSPLGYYNTDMFSKKKKSLCQVNG